MHQDAVAGHDGPREVIVQQLSVAEDDGNAKILFIVVFFFRLNNSSFANNYILAFTGA